MLYHFYEWNHAALTPFRALADATRLFYQNPLNPMSHTSAGRAMAAAAELFERTTRVYGKPEFGIEETSVNGTTVPVSERVVWKRPFCRLLHFDRALPGGRRKDPRFLVVAPMSGHYATLLRGTVEALLPYGEVHITDWADARMVPVTEGRFDLEDYADYVMDMLRHLGPDTHVVAVCQPAVPVLMAVARMEEDGDPCAPSTMTLMGGPIDTRINPTGVNDLAREKGIDWFRENVVMPVPFPQPGCMRLVYPGFLQLTGFMSMNLDRHMIAHKDFFWHLVKDDGDSAEKHREFYDEYNAVMDLTAEFYLQTVEEVFIKHSLPKGEMMLHGRPIDLKKIHNAALLTVEGENDDISGVGQTEAAQDLCVNIPDEKRVHYVQPKVGHYGVFNGSRFRAEIAPRIVDFALTHGREHGEAALPKKDREKVTGPRRTGAVAERRAKANALRGRREASGETGLAGAVTVAETLNGLTPPVDPAKAAAAMSHSVAEAATQAVEVAEAATGTAPEKAPENTGEKAAEKTGEKAGGAAAPAKPEASESKNPLPAASLSLEAKPAEKSTKPSGRTSPAKTASRTKAGKTGTGALPASAAAEKPLVAEASAPERPSPTAAGPGTQPVDAPAEVATLAAATSAAALASPEASIEPAAEEKPSAIVDAVKAGAQKPEPVKTGTGSRKAAADNAVAKVAESAPSATTSASGSGKTGAGEAKPSSPKAKRSSRPGRRKVGRP